MRKAKWRVVKEMVESGAIQRAWLSDLTPGVVMLEASDETLARRGAKLLGTLGLYDEKWPLRFMWSNPTLFQLLAAGLTFSILTSGMRFGDYGRSC